MRNKNLFPTVIFTGTSNGGYRLAYPDTLLVTEPLERRYILDLAQRAQYTVIGEFSKFEGKKSFSFRTWTLSGGVENEGIGRIEIPKRRNENVYLADHIGELLRDAKDLDIVPQFVLMILGQL